MKTATSAVERAVAVVVGGVRGPGNDDGTGNRRSRDLRGGHTHRTPVVGGVEAFRAKYVLERACHRVAAISSLQ